MKGNGLATLNIQMSHTQTRPDTKLQSQAYLAIQESNSITGSEVVRRKIQTLLRCICFVLEFVTASHHIKGNANILLWTHAQAPLKNG